VQIPLRAVMVPVFPKAGLDRLWAASTWMLYADSSEGLSTEFRVGKRTDTGGSFAHANSQRSPSGSDGSELMNASASYVSREMRGLRWGRG